MIGIRRAESESGEIDHARAEALRERREASRHHLVTAMVIAAGVVAVGLVTGLFIVLTSNSGGLKVPDVVGMSYESAIRKIESSGLQIEIDPEQDASSGGDVNKKKIEEQQPGAGTRAERGETVTVSLNGLDLAPVADVSAPADEKAVAAGGEAASRESAPAATGAQGSRPQVPAQLTAPPAVTAGRSVCLDPGHSTGSPVSQIDPATGLDVADNGGAAGEIQANWELAQKVRARLERDGYRVTTTKSSMDSYASLRARADLGNTCSIMVRLHFDPNLHALLMPGPGQYKQHGGSTVYVNPQVASSSAVLAQAMFPHLQPVGITRQMNDAGGTSNNAGDAYVVSALSRVPVVLIENDPTMVNGNAAGQDRVADSIVSGINAYFQNH